MSVNQVSAKEAFEILKNDKKSLLVDVRTSEELNFVGIVDNSDFDGRSTFIPWKIYPEMSLNKEFLNSLKKIAASSDTKLFFLCRSGGRSDEAAYFSTSRGEYENCYNIVGGFEGDKDQKNHRGNINGWKAENLPWVQS